jgi:hypothetical protein
MLQVQINFDTPGYWVIGKEKVFFPVDIAKLPSWLTGEKAKEAVFLTIGQHIIERQRRSNCWDHEHSRAQEGETWQSACLAMVEDDYGYILSNAHLPNDDAARNCAETLSLTVAFVDIGPGKVKKILFSGGPAMPWNNPPQYVLGDNQGEHPWPCGSCCDVVYNFGLPGGKTTVTVLPHGNPGSLILPYDYKGMSHIRRNQAFSVPVHKLLPHLTTSLSDTDGTLKREMYEGWRFIANEKNFRDFDVLDAVKGLAAREKAAPESIPTGIDEIMMQWFGCLYQKTDEKVKYAHLAILRIDGGRYYAGAVYTNQLTSSTHPATDNAMGMMRAAPEPRARITDVWSLRIDYRQLANLMQQRKNARVELALLDGNERERFKKAANGNGVKTLAGQILEPGNVVIHEFLPNGVLNFDPMRHIVTNQLKDLTPRRYRNPKSILEQQHIDTLDAV